MRLSRNVFCLFVFVFSTFGTFFFGSYEHIFQIRLVTVKRKVIWSYHKKQLCCWSPQSFSRFSLPPTRQRLFRAPEECEVFWKRRPILIINHTAHALKGMIPYFVLAFSRRRAKTIRILVYVWSRNWEKLSVFKNIRISEDEVWNDFTEWLEKYFCSLTNRLICCRTLF